MKTHLAIMTIAALALGGCTAQGSPAPTATETVPATATPSQTATAEPAESPSATATASPESAFDDPQTCTNPDLGFTVDYPGGWWANERVEPDDETLTPIEACTYFGPEEVALQPNAGLPAGIVIRFEARDQSDGAGDPEIVSRDQATVDGRTATVWEIRPAPQPGFIPEGTHMYEYFVDLADARRLVASTDDIQDAVPYEEAKEILDDMMSTIDIEDR
jgi:hypothetical protein